MRHARGSVRSGFTVIELLVVISVIAVLVALILPAVMSAREAARRTQCINHVKELALACLHHESAHQHFPTNGWGFMWLGEPDRGSNQRQPGGWVYNILPYLEGRTYREMGKSERGAARRAALTELSGMPLPVFNCPSRPDGMTGAANPVVVPRNADWSPVVAKTDYAICEGDYITDTRQGPRTLQEGDAGRYRWRDTTKATGVGFQRSRILVQHIEDGLGQTYLLGEKYVSTIGYSSAEDPGHDQSMYTGVDVDINRWTLDPPRPDGDEVGLDAARLFGSAHSGGFHMAFCDGSARRISYNIDAEVHRLLGNRKDGRVVDEAAYR